MKAFPLPTFRPSARRPRPKADLVDALVKAIYRIEDASVSVGFSGPHRGDYGAGYTAARAQHRRRLDMLAEIHEELLALKLAVQSVPSPEVPEDPPGDVV